MDNLLKLLNWKDIRAIGYMLKFGLPVICLSYPFIFVPRMRACVCTINIYYICVWTCKNLKIFIKEYVSSAHTYFSDIRECARKLEISARVYVYTFVINLHPMKYRYKSRVVRVLSFYLLIYPSKVRLCFLRYRGVRDRSDLRIFRRQFFWPLLLFSLWKSFQFFWRQLFFSIWKIF